MRKGIAASAAIAVAAALTAASVTPVGASTPLLARGPDGVTVEIATVNGSGCPIGTAAVAISQDKEAFTVTYSDYLAQTGGSSKPTDARKNCQIAMKVHVPQGFTYAIAQTDYRGYANLVKGAKATQKASYYFQGSSQTGAITHSIKSPHDDNWQFTDKIEVSQLVWKECGEQRNFNINTELRVEKGTSDASKVSFVAMDSTDGSIKTTYHFAWKRCP
ncbi:uncharacterized protein DUF4360 [Actinomadura pelletieri DSM 43383]|uniref:Uncharacterized protein DUF4360 n=1 Tax=Actinomadura pelletieri DSM 43383 TaxID=1120940 RepID=A0A495QX49_9ACTN|nr:DUF4360 domain-containing protein [Actinomadura pelletieri]RKS78683.1 uncharacterized protein DUF4360 [Actinomadura pelletieri DSM 43383]